MEPSLKKRLIGAAILVVIAAIVLPIFLGSPAPRQEGMTTLPVQVPPAPDRDMAQVTVPLGDVADPDRVVAIDTDRPDPAPMPTLPADPEPETTTPESPVAPVDATPPAAAPAQPRAAAPGPTAPAVADGARGRFWVGLGSYGQSANAERVITAAGGRGITVQRETVESGGRDLIRLRAGPYETRAQAEQARQLLVAAVPDAQPKIEESSAAATVDVPAPAPASQATPRAGAWAVQVGAFGLQANATQLSDRLKGAGFPAYVERRGESWAVRVGPYVRRTEAEAQRQRLKSAQQLDGLIVAHSG